MNCTCRSCNFEQITLALNETEKKGEKREEKGKKEKGETSREEEEGRRNSQGGEEVRRFAIVPGLSLSRSTPRFFLFSTRLNATRQ